MEPAFSNKQIIWAKVKGYPWWPAKICKLPTPESNVFKVQFIAEDTHAFLQPKDVRKYQQYYDECSKKKMRGLAPAIQSADQLHKKRQQVTSKTPTFIPEKKPRAKYSPKKKIKRPYHRKKKVSSDESQESESISESERIQPQQSNKSESSILQQQEYQSQDDNGNGESQKFQFQSEEKIDRNKVDTIEDNLIKIAEKIKQNTYQFNKNDFQGLQTLSGDQLLLVKITNLLNFIISKLPSSFQSVILKIFKQIQWLSALRLRLKQKIMTHLYDTSYYDQYIKLIQRNKRSRNEYEHKLTSYLKSQYKIKKQLAIVFSSRLVAEINNGTVSRYKQLLEDVKQRRIDFLSINNKAAIDRCIEALIPKYM